MYCAMPIVSMAVIVMAMVMMNVVAVTLMVAVVVWQWCPVTKQTASYIEYVNI